MMVKNDVGTVISLDTGVNISAATGCKILYKKPDGSCGEWAATAVDSAVQYTTAEGDIDQAGRWRLMAWVDLGDWSGSSSKATMLVDAGFSCG